MISHRSLRDLTSSVARHPQCSVGARRGHLLRDRDGDLHRHVQATQMIVKSRVGTQGIQPWVNLQK